MTKSHYALVIRAALRWMLRVSAAFPHHEIHECKYSGNKESRALFTSFTFLIFIPRLFLFAPPPASASAFLFPRVLFLTLYFRRAHFARQIESETRAVSILPRLTGALDIFPVLMNPQLRIHVLDNGRDRCSLPRYKSPSFCPGVHALL